jgi:MarR family transcriptional regulator for hemolysin
VQRPTETPIGIVLARTAKLVDRAFDTALTRHGASRPVWLILMSLKAAQPATQLRIADAVGIRGATLSHHLAGMETAGLIARDRDPADRRNHQVRLTDDGEALFRRLVGTAQTHDRRIRTGLSEDDVAQLRALLHRVASNTEGSEAGGGEPDQRVAQ